MRVQREFQSLLPLRGPHQWEDVAGAHRSDGCRDVRDDHGRALRYFLDRGGGLASLHERRVRA